MFCSRRRYIKRKLTRFMQQYAWITVANDFKIFFNAKDMKGPSFHLVHGKNKGFNDYESIDREEILNSLSKDRPVFIDIGANIGLFTYWLLNKNKSLVAFCFEPNAINFECLKQTKEINSLTNINLYNCAISDKKSQEKLYLSNRNDGGHSLFLYGDDKEEANFELVNTIPLDEVLPKELKNIDVIKIDVERFEEVALKGCLNTIKRYHPTLIIESCNQGLIDGKNILPLLKKEFENCITVRSPGSNLKRPLKDLKKMAKDNLARGKENSNYIYEFIENGAG